MSRTFRRWCIGPSMGDVLGMEPKGKRTTGSHTITKGGDEHLKQTERRERKEFIYDNLRNVVMLDIGQGIAWRVKVNSRVMTVGVAWETTEITKKRGQLRTNKRTVKYCSQLKAGWNTWILPIRNLHLQSSPQKPQHIRPQLKPQIRKMTWNYQWYQQTAWYLL